MDPRRTRSHLQRKKENHTTVACHQHNTLRKHRCTLFQQSSSPSMVMKTCFYCDDDAVASGASMRVFACSSFSLSVPLLPLFGFIIPSLHLLVTNAVGLQCAELESWLAVARVAGLHGNTLPTAAYSWGCGTLVNTCEKEQRCATF